MIQDILSEELFPRTRHIKWLLDLIDIPVIKVLTGMRRVGKSTLLKLFIQEVVFKKVYNKENILYINKEYPSYHRMETGDALYTFFMQWYDEKRQKSSCLLCIDEVQTIDEREKIVTGLLAQYGSKLQIIITGSNSTMLSSELATLLTGRVMEKYVGPLCYEERAQIRKESISSESFYRYLKRGGMPGTLAFGEKEDAMMSYLRDIYHSILTKDIVGAHQVRNISILNDLYHFVFANTGNIFSSSSIRKYLKQQSISIHIQTLLSYLHYAEQNFLFIKVKSANPQTKKRFDIYNKYYATDHGMRNAVAGRNLHDHASNVLENYVYNSLIMRGWKVFIGRLKNEKEIDFVAEKEGHIMYVQVAYLLENQATLSREYGALESIRDSRPKYIVSLDPVQRGSKNGIHHIQAWKRESVLH